MTDLESDHRPSYRMKFTIKYTLDGSHFIISPALKPPITHVAVGKQPRVLDFQKQ